MIEKLDFLTYVPFLLSLEPSLQTQFVASRAKSYLEWLLSTCFVAFSLSFMVFPCQFCEKFAFSNVSAFYPVTLNICAVNDDLPILIMQIYKGKLRWTRLLFSSFTCERCVVNLLFEFFDNSDRNILSNRQWILSRNNWFNILLFFFSIWVGKIHVRKRFMNSLILD